MKVEEHEPLLMMSLKIAPQFCLMFLLMISGANGNQWSVKYSKLHLCAVKGSTVVMEATYTHPTDVTVINRFWLINPVKGVEATDLRKEPGYSGRVEYLGDKQNHFSLRLSDVKKSDEHMYYFRFKTSGGGFQGFPGITLSVTDLQLIAPAEVTEGESVILTCKTTCSLTDPTFIWYKNTHDLTTNTFKSNELHLQRVSSEDAGSYNCAVRGSEHLPSPAQYLSVRYPPKNVSISPSGEIVEGSSVTLTCSSDANPPVETYTWFNETASVRKGKIFTISKVRSEDSGEYKCMCSNEVGHQNSTSVTLNVLYPPKNISVSISSSGEKAEGRLGTCSSDANPPVENYTWFKENETSRVGSGQSYRALQSGLYYCEAKNKLGSERSAAVSITITEALNGMNVAVYAGLVVLVCVCLIGVIILFKMKNKRTGSTVDQSIKQENLYENVTKNQVDPAFDSASANQEEVLYAKVVRRTKDAESSDADASGSGEDEVQYASVRFINSGAEYRPSNAEDPSVIYSSVK